MLPIQGMALPFDYKNALMGLETLLVLWTFQTGS